MLAEVASRTLRSESIHAIDSSTKSKQKVIDTNEEVCWNLGRIQSMPPNQLVKHFAIFNGDELKRRYSYECNLIPGCRQKYTSFASESKARVSITTHLVDHLERLRNSQDSCATLKATSVIKIGTKPKGSVELGKKFRGQQSKKPQETLNKENKLMKPERSGSYLRKILSNEINFKDFEREKKLEDENRSIERYPIKIKNEYESENEARALLGDHSYYEHVKDEVSTNGEYTREEAEAAIDEAMSENIMLMVVEKDRVRIEQLPSEARREELVESFETRDIFRGTTTAVVPPPPPPPGKPKGRAKFIGTSKEEREMALVLMERIKKKGNPSGSNLQCRICDPPRSFTAPTTLVSHYRSHAGIKPYECRICRSVFTRRHSLKYHMLIHQNQTRFTCADCGKKFRHPSHFREHRRRHTGESPFGCEDCGQRFKTRNTYKRHLKTRHGKVLTTSGELLCLTEEEFQKVQTNRKRKTRSVSSDCPMDEDESRLQSENNNEDSAIETIKTETMADDNGDSILYDGIVDEAGEQLMHSSIAMLDDLANCENGEYANVEIEYDDTSQEGVVIADNTDETMVNYNSEEYYEAGDSIEFEEKPTPNHDSPSILNKFPSVRRNKNYNNNNDEDEEQVEEEQVETNETITLQVDEKSAFIVLSNNHFKADYVRIEREIDDGMIIT
ncbi:zinc finger protein 595-like isoform X2 [Venturia canescens]|nr:zinc finger protein 595-like isoform X2 [Venturia canescens]XP_043277133.1 zinc finger protein 595-like isoform X2 [Venturia canescens]